MTSLGACGDDPVTLELDANGFAVFLGVDLTAMTETATGLLWQDFVVGAGEVAVVEATVALDYSGWLKTGELFDNSDSGPIQFALGTGFVIPGWDEGIVGMRVGGTRRLIIPPHLAYGASGQGSIPPNATLVFDVRLVSAVPPSSP